MFGLRSMRRAEGNAVARAAAFAGDCRASSVELQADRLREAHALFAARSPASCAFPAIEAIESMIATEAFDSAALAMIGADRSFVLSRGGSGICMATLIGEQSGTEISAEGASPALALLAAAALAASEEEPRPSARRRERFYTPAARVE